MKKLQLVILTFILSCFSIHVFSQDITGIWNGTIYNDTTKQFYPYQLAISDDNGKLSGYSYTVYDIDGKKEVGVREIKIKKKGAGYIIEDVELVYNNYAEAPPKGIHKMSIVTLTTEDTLMTIKGSWHSNRTKKFLPLSGTLEVHKKSDYKNSELFKKLEDLKLDNALSFTPKAVKTEPSETAVAAAKKEAEKKAEKEAKEAEEKKRKEEKLLADAKKKEEKAAEDKRIKEEKLAAAAAKKAEKEAEEKRAKDEKLAIAAAKKAEKEAEEKRKNEEKLIAAAEKNKKKEPIVETPVVAVVTPPANNVDKRKTVSVQEVFFKSDSLTISLFDNGEVDGDVVTVLMNGQIIMPNVSLTVKAVRKTIYIDKATPDSLLLVMFAENLGSIPPNTGLLVVNDGNDIYEVRFSADLQTNAAILLRRKKRLQ